MRVGNGAHHPRAVRPSLPARGGTHVVPPGPFRAAPLGPLPQTGPRAPRELVKGVWGGPAGILMVSALAAAALAVLTAWFREERRTQRRR